MYNHIDRGLLGMFGPRDKQHFRLGLSLQHDPQLTAACCKSCTNFPILPLPGRQKKSNSATSNVYIIPYGILAIEFHQLFNPLCLKCFQNLIFNVIGYERKSAPSKIQLKIVGHQIRNKIPYS